MAGAENSALSSERPAQLYVPQHDGLLCYLCRSIRRPEQFGKTLPHRTYLDLKISAARGCALCQFFYKSIGLHQTKSNFSSPLLITPSQSTVSVLDYAATSFDFEIFPIVDSSDVPTFRQTASHSDSTESWNFIKNMINICSSSHPNCVHHQSQQLLPTRVLDVSGDTVRLVDSRTLDSQTRPYATLSYCWGSQKMLTTTTQNIEYLSKGIDVMALPKIHCDAIRVTRELKIGYLWIDALCIIQDDMMDWSVEAANMGQYYENSVLTISALDARNTSVGFLNPRTAGLHAPIGEGLNIRSSHPSWSTVFRESPLSQRAWILQERLMSTRILHFGADEIFWECSTFSTRESCEDLYTLTGSSAQQEDENFKRSLQFTESDPEEILKSWYSVICQYTSLQMTMALDKFPAVSGIARAFHEATGYLYIAGIWKEHAHSGLLWYSHQQYDPKPRYRITSEEYIAPSWSWASIDGPVKMLFSKSSKQMKLQNEAQLLDARISLPKNDPYSRVLAASLLLDACCIEVWQKGSHSLPPFNDSFLARVLEIYDSNGIMIGTGYLDCLEDSSKESLNHALAVVISQRLDPTLSSDPITYFLLVVHSMNEGEPAYRRIGIGQTADPYRGTVIKKDIIMGAPRREVLII